MKTLARKLALLALALTLPAAPALASNATVTIKNFDYAPMALTITAGSTVTWKNEDGEPHTVVSIDGLFRSPALDQGDVFTFKFDKTGVYKYVCTIHPKMMATVVVK